MTTQQTYYRRQKERKLCVSCPNKPQPGRLRCYYCDVNHLRACRAYRAKYRVVKVNRSKYA